MSTQKNQPQQREVEIAHGEVNAVHLGPHYKRALPGKILKSRRTYAPIFMLLFAFLGVWYLGLSSASPHVQSGETTQQSLVNATNSLVEKPLVNARLAFGFWWEKYIFHYNMHLSFGTKDEMPGYEYLLARNGQQLYRGPDAVYQDYNVGPGNEYVYQVWAINQKGEYSEPVSYSTRLSCTWILCSEEN